jgi:hypothetical protein
VHKIFWWGHLRARAHLEYLDVEGRVILKWVFEKWDRETDWINLSQGKVRWGVLFDAVLNLRVP